MFGTSIRAAVTFAGGMLMASVLKTALQPFLDIMKPSLPKNHIILTSLQEIEQQFVILVLFSVALAFIARAVVESRLGGGI